MENCLFCKIVKGEIPCAKVYEDDKALAFSDIDPQAPVHVLIIPKAHYANVLEAGEKDAEILSHLLLVAGRVAKEKGVEESGFRLVVNTGKDGGQSVEHLHVHLMGGRACGWPAG